MPSWNIPRESRHAYTPPLGLPSARNCFHSATNVWASSTRKRMGLAESCPTNTTPISTASSLISSPFCLSVQFSQLLIYLPQCGWHQAEDDLLVIPLGSGVPPVPVFPYRPLPLLESRHRFQLIHLDVEHLGGALSRDIAVAVALDDVFHDFPSEPLRIGTWQLCSIPQEFGNDVRDRGAAH